MIRIFKAVVSALTSLLLVGALVVAPTASAQFEAEAPEATFKISSNSVKKFKPNPESPAVECTTVGADYTPLGITEAETVESIPTYSNCENFLGTSVSIDTNGCVYVAHLAKGKTSGTVDVECPSALGIEITVGSICKYSIGTQTGLGTVTYKNTGSGATREIIGEANVTGVTVTRTTNHFFCPAGGTNGSYSGTATVTAEAGGNHVGIWVD